MEQKKKKAARNLRLVKGAKSEDNKAKPADSQKESVELTFHSDSKAALEGMPDAKKMVMAMHALTAKYSREIHTLGKKFGVDLDVRTVFMARTPKE